MNELTSLLDSPDIAFLPFPKHPPDHSLEIRRAYVDHFSTYPWDHFATLTFASSVGTRVAVREVHDRYRRRLEQEGQRRVDYLGALEYGPAGGRLHIHLLLAGTSSLGVEAVQEAWTAGIADVRIYDPGRGPGYVVKTLASPDSHLLLREARTIGPRRG